MILLKARKWGADYSGMHGNFNLRQVNVCPSKASATGQLACAGFNSAAHVQSLLLMFKFSCAQPLLAFALLLSACGLSAQEGAAFDCDYLLGNWTGQYTYPWGETYRWRAELDESGQWRVYFYNSEGDQYDYQEGFWDCDGEILSTWIEENGLGVFVNEYRILELSRAEHVYEYISGGEPGPVYRAVRDRPLLRTFE